MHFQNPQDFLDVFGATSSTRRLGEVLGLSAKVAARLAKQRGRRLSERSLLLLAGLFGAIGGVLGMYLFRHKTKHPRFQILMPLFAFLQLLLLAATIYIRR